MLTNPVCPRSCASEQRDAEFCDPHRQAGLERAVAGDADGDRLNAVGPVRRAAERVVGRADEDIGEQQRVAAAVAAAARWRSAPRRPLASGAARAVARPRAEAIRSSRRRTALGSSTGCSPSSSRTAPRSMTSSSTRPIGAVDRDAIALPGRVRVQRIAERGARGVVDDEREVVLDRDAARRRRRGPADTRRADSASR